jgi:hypothetical protein
VNAERILSELADLPFKECVSVTSHGGMGDAIHWPLAIAIPARDEELRIVQSLTAIQRALIEGERDGGVVLVVNNTTDKSYDTAQRWLEFHQIRHVIVNATFHPSVSHAGMARRLAMDLARHAVQPGGILLTTDADTEPRPDWVRNTLQALSNNADIVCGVIDLAVEEARGLPEHIQRELAAESEYRALTVELNTLVNSNPYLPWRQSGSAGGASLGFRQTVYDDVGGIPLIPCGEDGAFVAEAVARDWRVRFVENVRVTTSCRLVGRARGGLADGIAARISDTEPCLDEALEPAIATLLRARACAALRREWIDGSSSAKTRRRLGLSDKAEREMPAFRYFGERWNWYEQNCAALRRARLLRDAVPRELPVLRAIVTRERSDALRSAALRRAG